MFLAFLAGTGMRIFLNTFYFNKKNETPLFCVDFLGRCRLTEWFAGADVMSRDNDVTKQRLKVGCCIRVKFVVGKSDCGVAKG